MESFNLLLRIARYLVPEYRFKYPRMAWWNDEDFTAYLDRFGGLELTSDSRWMLQQLMRLVVDVPGDTAECGANDGAGSFLIARMTAASRQGRTHYAIDSFEGLSEPVSSDGGYWTAGDLSVAESTARENLAGFGDAVVVCKGWIPEVLREVPRGPFAFVYVDVDLYQPTIDSMEYFYPLLSPGAVFVCDDYGSTFCPGVTRAGDEFLSDKPEKMIALPSGSGFFVKGTVTQPPISPLPPS